MKAENIKQAVSDYLKMSGFEVLDLFYKMPCNKCDTIDSWDKFSFLPDLIIKRSNFYSQFAFIAEQESALPNIAEFISKNSVFGSFSVYIVTGKSLYEIKDIKLLTKILLTDELLINEKVIESATIKTFKSQAGKWEEHRQFGILGERDLFSFLKKFNISLLDLNFNAPCDACSNIENWKKYNKLPDGIGIDGHEMYFFDAKAKTSRQIIVNERDYIEYQYRTKFLPVRIYFLIYNREKSKLLELYEHKVSFEKHNTIRQWDGNLTVDLSSEVNQLF